MASQRLTLLTLPGEIRELIYTKLLAPVETRTHLGEVPNDGHKRYRFDLRVLRLNRQIYHEARQVFRRLNIFVGIETPFPEAEQYVRIEGYVPLVVSGAAALQFRHTHLDVKIDVPPPVQQHRERPLTRFIILREDLPAFCQMWHYSDLGHEGLNAHLSLKLDMRDPYASAHNAHALPKALQRELLEPFGKVKGLYGTEVVGEVYSSIEKAMRKEMEVPYASPEKCLEEGTRLKDKGNAELQNGNYRSAITLYEDAFLAIHIVCEGRRRSVWADPFFERELASGEWKGAHGGFVRFLLRCRLVANVVWAYVKLEDYAEARFWGRRTIDLFEGGFGEAVMRPEFHAAKEMGKIYYRTALAAKELGEPSEARKLLAVAVKFLPNDRIVRDEQKSLALPLM